MMRFFIFTEQILFVSPAAVISKRESTRMRGGIRWKIKVFPRDGCVYQAGGGGGGRGRVTTLIYALLGLLWRLGAMTFWHTWMISWAGVTTFWAGVTTV